MSSAEHTPTNRPVPGASLEAVGYVLGLQFHEPIKLLRQKGMEFGAKLSSLVDLHGVELQENVWVFSQPLGESAAGVLRVVVQGQTLEFDIQRPTHGLDWLENRFELILDDFRKMFKPAAIISTMAKASGTVDIDGDARRFLFEHVAKIPESRMDALRRPVQIVGIRLGMPIFPVEQMQGDKRTLVPGTDWVADVRAESLGTDVRRLFLEGLAQWPLEPKPWNAAATKEAATRITTIKNYLIESVLPFLTAETGDE